MGAALLPFSEVPRGGAHLGQPLLGDLVRVRVRVRGGSGASARLGPPLPKGPRRRVRVRVRVRGGFWATSLNGRSAASTDQPARGGRGASCATCRVGVRVRVRVRVEGGPLKHLVRVRVRIRVGVRVRIRVRARVRRGAAAAQAEQPARAGASSPRACWRWPRSPPTPRARSPRSAPWRDRATPARRVSVPPRQYRPHLVAGSGAPRRRASVGSLSWPSWCAGRA